MLFSNGKRMLVQFLKTIGLLFNFLVAIEANQGVTLSNHLRPVVYLRSLHHCRHFKRQNINYKDTKNTYNAICVEALERRKTVESCQNDH